ncbi:hypothetical protein AgCh_018748 [Apium graveolens]
MTWQWATLDDVAVGPLMIWQRAPYDDVAVVPLISQSMWQSTWQSMWHCSPRVSGSLYMTWLPTWQSSQVAYKISTDHTPFEAWTRLKPDIGHVRVFGCVAHMKTPEDQVKKLDDRSIQAPRAWYSKLSGCLESLGFVKCLYEPAVYTKRMGGESLEQMNSKFDMSDMGKLSYYLGIEVKQEANYIELKLAAYARKVLEKVGIPDCNPSNPMDPKGTLEYGLVYANDSGNNVLTGYSDSGHVATAAACQAIWLWNVLKQITGETIEPVVIYIDKKSAIDLSKNTTFYGRNKHIDVRYHFIRECVERGEIMVKHVDGENQRADSVTKEEYDTHDPQGQSATELPSP